MDDLVGKKLKDYYVLRRLGRGAMAEVYLAQQLSLGRQVALKVLNVELARDPVYVQRFEQEARAAARAGARRASCRSTKWAATDGVHYIAQEYIAGRNLGEVIRSHGSLEPRLALDILRQVSFALAKAASEGIVHRDIKPENIMLARSGEVKVADFGLARVQGDHLRAVPRREPHASRRDDGHAALHEPRADRRSAPGQPERHLLARHHGLSHVVRLAALHRRHAAVGGRASISTSCPSPWSAVGRTCRNILPAWCTACLPRTRPSDSPTRPRCCASCTTWLARARSKDGRQGPTTGRLPSCWRRPTIGLKRPPAWKV